MPATSDQRALATALGAQTDAELAATLTRRGISPSVTWRDFFDAAEGMLEPAVIARALAGLGRDDAAALAAAVAAAAAVDAAHRAALSAAALADAEGVAYQAVAAAVRERPPIDDVPLDDPPSSSPATQAAVGERAFTNAASLADLLLRAMSAPLARIGSGGLGAAERRALVESGAVPDPDTADLLVEIADTVGLLSGGERAWLATPDARTWVTTPTVQRWAHVATALRDALPAGIRTADGGWLPVTAWDGAYPYDPAWPAQARRWRARFVGWGMIAPDDTIPAWSSSLAAGGDADAAALQALLPPEVDRVYLQNDLTAIAPGPLAPHLDVRLRTMARRESRAQASSYRFDAASISAAITAGETAESMRAFLETLSLTGLPQPLAYVIERTADSHGRVRVALDDAGHARVSSDDAATIDTIAVDQALRSVGLVRDGDDLVSRVGVDAVFWALADARYPVIAVDGKGMPRTLERARLAPEAAATAPVDAYAPLLERLRSASAGDDAAWLERELDQAVRARSIVDVVVALPDGSERTFRLEATGLGGGRLRGRDRGADVERTVPLTSIRGVHPVA